MFDCDYKYKLVSQKEIDAFIKIKDISVYGYCSLCLTKIQLTWSQSATLKGKFKSLNNTFSEVWEGLLLF